MATNKIRVYRGKGDNGYCGPAALSLLTGRPVAEVTRNARHVSGRRAIFGMPMRYMKQVLQIYGLNVMESFDHLRGCTLARWLRDTRTVRDMQKPYLLSLTGHYVVVRGRKIYDNKHPEGTFGGAFPNRRKRVRHTYQIIKTVEIEELEPKTAPQDMAALLD